MQSNKSKWLHNLRNSLFILPVMAVNTIFFIIPFVKTVYMSFFNWPLLGQKKFIAFQNYVKAFVDTKFLRTLVFTFKYAILVTPMLFFIAFVMALLVKHYFRGVGIFRTVYFLPVVISMTSCSDIWLWIYNELYGVLNYILTYLGITDHAIAWMHQPSTSLPAVCVMVTWKMAGFSMLMLLGAMQSIDEQLYEAASIDGASGAKRFFGITLPLIRPTIGLSLVISVIGSVLAFEQFKIMTLGGPSSKTQTAVYYIYEQSFGNYKFGYGAAMSLILLLILGVLSYFQFAVMKDTTE